MFPLLDEADPNLFGANFADIGRIASKHVKVTVSQKNSHNSRPVTALRKTSKETVMQQPKDTKESAEDNVKQSTVEEMDTTTEGITVQ